MKKQDLSWLFREIPVWVKKGLISGPEGEGIRKFYSKAPDKDIKPAVLAVFGILGSVLFGGGIILLLAHNWYEIPRFIRTLIALLPLAGAQVFAFMVIYKEKKGFVWRESAAVSLLLMIASSIALIGQIYHIPGNLEGFFFIWLICAIPVCYFLKSNIAVMLCLAGAAAWAVLAQTNQGNAVFYWIFFLSLVPYLYLSFRKFPGSNETLFLGWVFIAALCSTVGVTLEKVIPGMWIAVYSAFFCLLFMLDREFQSRDDSIFKRPFLLAGTAGTGVLSFILSMNWPWENIGLEYYRSGGRFQEIPALADYAVLAVFAVPAVFLFIRHAAKDPAVLSFYFALLPASIAGFLLPGYGTLIFSSYSVLLALSMVLFPKIGIQKQDFSLIGLMILAAVQGRIPFWEHYAFYKYWVLSGSFLFVLIFMRTRLLLGKAAAAGQGLVKFAGAVLMLGFLYSITFVPFSWHNNDEIPRFPAIGFLDIPAYLAVCIFIWKDYWKENRAAAVFIAIFPLITGINYLAGGGLLLFNLYFAAAAVALILFGIRKNRTAVSNGGILLLALQVGTRFFDESLSFAVKGLAFVLLGALFIGLNIFLHGRKTKGAEK